MVWVQLALAVVTWVVGSLLRKGPDIDPAAFEDFGFPDIDPTKRVPIIWGKKRIKSVHTMEVQDYFTKRIKEGNFIKKTTVGFKYYSTVAIGICRGPDVVVTKIILGDKVLWEGTSTVSDSGFAIAIDNDDFFGKDNGVAGTIRIYPGSDAQTMNAVLAADHAALGGAPDFPDIPYRGIAYAVFEDFYWGNQPQIPQIEFVCERYPDTLGIGAGRKVNTTPNESPTEGAVDLAIPEIIHEILTQQDWGLAEPTADVDSTSLTAAATTLSAEGNAASFIWNTGDSIRELMATLMKQADGFVFKRMSTGLWEMNLARDDYLLGSPDDGDITEFDETNSSLIRFTKGTWDETFNSINVNWTDRNVKGRPPPAYVQDMANFANQGGRQDATFTVPGCHSRELAGGLAGRFLKQLSFPLATAEITTNRLAFNLVPGDVVRFSWDKLGLVRIWMRINRIDSGTPEQGEVRISLVQDVFGINQTLFSQPGTSLATPQNPDPLQVAEAFVADQTPFLAGQDPDNTAFGEKPKILAKAPQGNALQYRPYAKLSAATEYTEQDVDWGYAASGTLQSDIEKDAGDIIASVVVENVDRPVDLDLSQTATEQKELGAGMIIVVAPSTSPETVSPGYGDIGSTYSVPEVLTYDSASVSGSTVTLSNVHRGMDDTVPRKLKAGDKVWFAQGTVGTTVDVYGDFSSVDVKLQNEATTGGTDISGATNFPFTMRRRQDRPVVPGGLEIGSSTRSPLYARYPGNSILPPGDLLFRWNRRDRDALRSSMYYQTDADDPPAANYEVDLHIYEIQDGTPTFLRTISGAINGATYTKAQQIADKVYNEYMVVLQARRTDESPHLFSLTEERQTFKRNPFISPLGSPTPPLPPQSPISPRYGSPVVSPLSPIHSPLSPHPSPISPFPQSPGGSSPFPSPSSPVASPISPIPSPKPSPAIPPVPPPSPQSPQAAQGGFRGYIISEGPTLYWTLEDAPTIEASPAAAKDSPISSQIFREEMVGQDGTSNGPVSAGNYPITRDNLFSAGNTGENDSYIEVADHVNLDFADTWSVEFWFVAGKQVDNTNDQVTLVARSASNHEFSVGLYDDNAASNQGKLRCLIQNSGNSPNVTSFFSTDRFDDGLPHYVVVQQNVSGGDAPASIYVDGFLQGQGQSSPKPGAASTPFYINGRPVDSSGSLLMNHVAIYNKVLTEAEIINHYMEGKRWDPWYGQALKNGATAWWRGVNVVGDSVRDWIGTVDGSASAASRPIAQSSGGPITGRLSPFFAINADASPFDYVDLGDNAFTKANQTRGGCSFWYRRGTGSPTGTAFVLTATAASTTEYFSFFVDATGRPGIAVRLNGSGNQALFYALDVPAESPINFSDDVNDGQWHHLVMLKRTNVAGVEIWIDGIEYNYDTSLTGTATADDWMHDLPASTHRWAIGARKTAGNVADGVSDFDLAEVMYWEGAANLPTAAEITALYIGGKKHFPSMTERFAEAHPEHLIEVSDDDANVPDLFNNLPDGTYTGNGITRDEQMPMAADDASLSVHLTRDTSPKAFLDFASDGFLKSQSDVTSPIGNMPRQFSLAFTAMHEMVENTDDVFNNRMMVFSNTTSDNSALNFYAEIENDGIIFDAFPPSNKWLGVAPGEFRAGHGRLMFYVQNAKYRGGFQSPQDNSYRRIFADGSETGYDLHWESPLPSPLGSNHSRNYIEQYAPGSPSATSNARIGDWRAGNPRSFGGLFGHLAAYARNLADEEHVRIGLRRMGWQEFPLEVMKYQPYLYWRCDDAAGSFQVQDVAGSSRHGTMHGTVVLDSVSLNSALWHADTGVANCNEGAVKYTAGATIVDPGTSSFTYGAWIQLPTTESPLNSVLAQLSLYDNSETADYHQTLIQAGSPIGDYRVLSSFGTDGADNRGSISLVGGQWYFIVTTWDITDNTQRVYVDGVEDVSHAGGSPSAGTAGNYNSFAINSREGASPITGNVQDAAYHDVFLITGRALSLAEIREMHARAFAPSYDVMVEVEGGVAHWKLNELSGRGDAAAFLNSIQDTNSHYLVSSASNGASPQNDKAALPLLGGYPDNSTAFDGQGLDTGWLTYPSGDADVSHSFWMQDVGGFAGLTGVIFSYGNSAGGGGSRLTCQLAGGASPHVIRIDIGGSTTIDWDLPNDGLAHHYCFVYSGSPKDITAVSLYIDGVLQTSVANAGTSVLGITQTNNFHIGAFCDGTASPLSGVRLSRLAVFDKSLRLDEIRGLYLAGSGISVTSP